MSKCQGSDGEWTERGARREGEKKEGWRPGRKSNEEKAVRRGCINSNRRGSGRQLRGTIDVVNVMLLY